MTFSRLGICTRYGLHEATYAATRIGRWFESLGGVVSYFSPQPISHLRGLPIDGDIQSPPATLFTKWARAQDGILWTHIPQIAQLRWSRGLGLRTTILAFWSELSGVDLEALRAADCVLCPFRLMAEYLRECRVPRAVAVPWDTGDSLVQSCNDVRNQVRILMPVYDGIARRVERTALLVLARAVARFPDVSATVLYSASSISPAGLRSWRDHRKLFPGRIDAFSGIDVAHRPLILQNYDVVFWPTQFENTGMAGLSAVAAGAPVIAFDFPTTRECFNKYNAVLAPTQFKRNGNGMPVVANPDYSALEDTLHGLLRDRPRLAALQQNVLKGASQRRSLFQDVLATVFTG